MDLSIIGENLKNIREQKGLSLRQVAENVNMDYSHISKIENGQTPSLHTLMSLVEFYEVNFMSIFNHNEYNFEINEWTEFVREMKNEKITPNDLRKYIHLIEMLKDTIK